MKEGEDGSETNEEESELNGGWIERPFIFLGRRGAGDVIGRSRCVSDRLRLAIPDRPANGVGANVVSGIEFTGESGEEDGEGSERSEESVQDTVVVGDDSADSAVVCVDVLSLCLCVASLLGRRPGSESLGSLVASMARLGSTTVTRLGWSMVSASRSNTDINEGIWSS